MSKSSNVGTPDLASDGLCANTGCAIRETDQCPIYRMMRDIAVPAVNNVVNLANERGERAGFKISEARMSVVHIPGEVSHLEDERDWRKIRDETIMKETHGSPSEIISKLLAISKVKNAEIIPFPTKEKV